MAKHVLEDTIALLGGAALGAAAMYLLDPDKGDARRRDIQRTAREAVHHTGDALSATLSHATSAARDATSRLSSHASSLAQDAGHQTSHLGDQAASLASNLRSHASDLVDSLSGTATGWRKNAANAVQSMLDSAQHHSAAARSRVKDTADDLSDRAHSLWSDTRRSATEKMPDVDAILAKYTPASRGVSATGIASGTLGALAAGAGVMYFFDPQQGRGRRAWVRDKAFSVTRRAGKSARSYGRHLANSLHGVTAKARRNMPEAMQEYMPRENSSAQR